MVEQLPSYLSEAFGKAVGQEMTLAKGIHDSLGATLAEEGEPPKGLGAFARGLLRLRTSCPTCPPPGSLIRAPTDEVDARSLEAI